MSVCLWCDGFVPSKHYCDEKDDKMINGQRFSYVKYDAESIRKQETLKGMFEAIEQFCDAELKPGRAASLIHTKLEEAYMWTGKAIRDEQIDRNSQTEHLAERSSE